MQKLWIARRANEVVQEPRSTYMFQDVGSETASDLIKQAGIGSLKVGKVSLIDDDPNFFVVEEGAKSAEVAQLIDEVRKQTKEKLDVELQTAIKIW